MTPRRCTALEADGVHCTWSRDLAYTLCEAYVDWVLLTDNTDPVTCTRCIAALTRLGDAIDACLEGRSG